MLRSKEIALIGVFTALIAALRPIGIGAIGIEPMWFALILVARALGPKLGSAIGALSMTLSAVLTGGFGPWLPWQILAASCIGFGVAVIPKNLRGKVEITLLVFYAIIAAEFYGLLLDLAFWPIALGTQTQLSFDSQLSFTENATRFLTYHFVGALAWDVPRAILTATLIAVTGKSVLYVVRRALRPTVIIGHAMQPSVVKR